MAKQDHEIAKIAIDPVIFTVHDKKLKILLQTRDKEPGKGKYELPGGLLLPKETAEETLKRKLAELIGQSNIFFTQFKTFTDPSRDPRGRTVSIGFIALISEDKIKKQELWYECDDLPDLAFDHKNIIKTARDYLKENMDSLIVKQFMPKQFPLNKLQEVYEIIEDKHYDNRNFRKKMIISEIVEETEQLEQEVSHRPAKLFKFRSQ